METLNAWFSQTELKYVIFWIHCQWTKHPTFAFS